MSGISKGTLCVPGRVNLMGDHIDYLGFDVLPMAIDRAVEIEYVALDRPFVEARSRAIGESIEFELDCNLEPVGAGAEAGAEAGHWSNYIRAAGRWMACRSPDANGVAIDIRSRIPAAAGLSSSSAVVIGTALALLKANGVDVDPMRLARELAEAERFVGTLGGGMDQAVCLMGRAGHACRIGFDPLSVDHVRIPDDWVFIVADSGIRAAKSGANQDAYNERAVVTRSAVQRLARAGVLTIDAVRALEPRERAYLRHAMTERDHVVAAATALAEDDIGAFGSLMTKSHDSLRNDCGVSCFELDMLVEAAVAGGAEGARLTGAGMGGCIVALTTRDQAAAVLDYIEVVQGETSMRGSGTFVVEASDGALAVRD
ncbi:MAG: galactokinase [Gemmatimonadales bacterium]